MHIYRTQNVQSHKIWLCLHSRIIFNIDKLCLLGFFNIRIEIFNYISWDPINQLVAKRSNYLNNQIYFSIFLRNDIPI